MTNGVAISSRRDWTWMTTDKLPSKSEKYDSARPNIRIISHVCLFARVGHMAQCPHRALYQKCLLWSVNMWYRHEAVPPVEGGYCPSLSLIYC